MATPANDDLLAEAATVYAQTGLTPRGLQARHREMVAIMEKAAHALESALKVYAIPTSPPCTAELLRKADELVDSVPILLREALKVYGPSDEELAGAGRGMR